ncbi:unnamed protein product [Calicophoron daubneyi]|uniref:Uncharacterized protein n=1 Tax=Calicophoron daubneyi TaxID=300641 RepID=A0AAV2TPP1_CALDB
MAKLAGTWHFVSHENVHNFIEKVGGEVGEFVEEFAAEEPKMTITFPDHEHVVFHFRHPDGKEDEEKCKFGVPCEHSSSHGKKFKSVLAKVCDHCMVSDLQDTAHPAHTIFELYGHELHIISKAGDVTAVTKYARG